MRFTKEDEPYFNNPVCSSCGDPCKGEWEDMGIGSYEFWGSKGTDVDWQFVSNCCGAEIEEQEDYEERTNSYL